MHHSPLTPWLQNLYRNVDTGKLFAIKVMTFGGGCCHGLYLERLLSHAWSANGLTEYMGQNVFWPCHAAVSSRVGSRLMMHTSSLHPVAWHYSVVRGRRPPSRGCVGFECSGLRQLSQMCAERCALWPRVLAAALTSFHQTFPHLMSAISRCYVQLFVRVPSGG